MVVKKRDPLLDPRCCTYKLSGKIRGHVDRLLKDKELDKETKSILTDLMDEEEANKNTLTYDSLVKLHKFIQRADQNYTDPFYLFADDCKCIEPKPRENKQLESRLRALRLRDSQSIYNNMTASIDRAIEDELEKQADGRGKCCKADNLSSNVYSNNNNNNTNIQSEFKRLNGSLVAVINSFLVFICTFVFCYKALEYALPQPNIIVQVLFGLGGSTLVAIAELYFLMRVV